MTRDLAEILCEVSFLLDMIVRKRNITVSDSLRALGDLFLFRGYGTL